MSELVQSFQASGKDGRTVKINAYQATGAVPGRFGNLSSRNNLQLETSQGQKVKFVAKGQYKIVASGEILTCDDPTAPKSQ